MCRRRNIDIAGQRQCKATAGIHKVGEMNCGADELPMTQEETLRHGVNITKW